MLIKYFPGTYETKFSYISDKESVVKLQAAASWTSKQVSAGHQRMEECQQELID